MNMNLQKFACALPFILLATLIFAFPARAAVTFSWSAGASCGNPANVGFSPGGSTFQESLCASTPLATERGCGFSAVLLAASASQSGAFSITARTLGANYPDPNAAPAIPFLINNPTQTGASDFGGTIALGGTSVAPAMNQLLATFTFQPQASATNSSYVIGLAPASEFSIDVKTPTPDPTCGTAGNSGAALPFLTLNLVNTPAFTSAATTTLNVSTAGAFNVTATGTPSPTFSAAGALPAGVSLSSSGLLAGTPQSGSAGTYLLIITAANGTLPNAIQSFSLIVAKRSQTISFGAIAGQLVNSSPITIAGASASSSLPLTFTSTTSNVCNVSGAVVSFTNAGNCSISATQNGNADFNPAAPVVQSFSIFAVAPGAPIIGEITAGNQSLIIAFTPPANTGGSPILDYTADCTGGASARVTGTGSPMLVTGLANGTAYSCSVSARNAAGTGPSSAAANGTPVTSAITLTSNTIAAGYGAPVTLIASVTGNGQSGTVSFSVSTGSGSVVLPGCNAITLVNGLANCTAAGIYQSQNPRQYVATYSGDAGNASATATLSQVVAINSAVVTVTANPLPPIVFGRTATLTAMIKMSSPSGTVTFTDNGVPVTGCVQTSVSLLPDATDSAVVNCMVTVAAATAGIKQYVATYFYPAGHISGRVTEQTNIDVRVVAQGPLDYTDMWWAGTSENGWGISVTQHGPIQFNVIFAYDELGKSLWYVMPGGNFNAAGNVFTGSLYLPTSSPFSAYDKNRFVIGAPVGIATITYTGQNTATLAYTINGISATKSIQRQVFSAETSGPNLRINDLWWATFAEDGWGMNIAQQGRVLFPVWYTYDAAGKATFFTVQAGSWRGTVWSGTVYAHASSAWLGVPYNPAPFTATIVGNMTLDFSDASNATMTYTVNGITQVKTIQRQPY